jgi:hypothetical protein
VFDDVVEALLHDAIERDGGFLGEEVVERHKFRDQANRGGGGDLLDHIFEGLGETKTIQVIGPQVSGNLAHFLDRLRGGNGKLLELLSQLRLSLAAS